MTSFNIPPDDVGIRNLRSSNTQPSSAKQVDAVPAYPHGHPVRPGVPTPVERAVQQVLAQRTPEHILDEHDLTISEAERRDRRERRRRQEPVILDTRSGRERRQLTSPGNETALEEGEVVPRLGIDLYT